MFFSLIQDLYGEQYGSYVNHAKMALSFHLKIHLEVYLQKMKSQ